MKSAKRGGASNPAFMKPLKPDEILAAIIGPEARPRTQITKDIWAYIKANNLQDPANRKMIKADEKLRKLFGKDSIGMMELAGIVSKHVSG